MKKYLGIAVAATLVLSAPAYAWNGNGSSIPTDIQPWAWNGGECAVMTFAGDNNVYEINSTQLGEKGYEHFYYTLHEAYVNQFAVQVWPGGTEICGGPGSGVVPIIALNLPCVNGGKC